MLTTITIIATTFLFLPLTIRFAIRLFLRIVGYYFIAKTKGRKDILFEKAEGDQNQNQDGKSWHGIIGFFHPFCNAGGGGERVLWAAIRATQETWPMAVCIVYTGDHDVEKMAIIKRVQDRFNITLNPRTLHFLYLSTRRFVLASTYPRFTLVGQSLGSLVLALDAFNLCVPDIYVDTMGYAFTMTLCKFLFPNVPTGAYVHYPTISTDMLSSLDESADSGKGIHAGTGAGTIGRYKRRYWQLFAKWYSWAGTYVDVVMANSSWTKQHIQDLWGKCREQSNLTEKQISLVFPPVAVLELQQQISTPESQRLPHILYIAQFRPEKNHALIIEAFAKLMSSKKWPVNKRPKLVLVGSVRDREDALKVYKLRLDAHVLQLKNDIEFVCNASWPQVLKRLKSSSIGVNGMWNEHFGIGVVEYQASGLISVVNDSGGPKLDIVVDVDGKSTGFHASTVEEYASAFSQALSLDTKEIEAMRLGAKKSSLRFSEEVFAVEWIKQMAKLINLQTNNQ